jgi:hypothetical protein
VAAQHEKELLVSGGIILVVLVDDEVARRMDRLVIFAGKERRRVRDMRTRRYKIIVSGRLGMIGHEAFRDSRIEPHGMDTALTADLNRSDLHHVLTRIRDLALDLVGLTCLAPEQRARHRRTCAPDVDQLRPRVDAAGGAGHGLPGPGLEAH